MNLTNQQLIAFLFKGVSRSTPVPFPRRISSISVWTDVLTASSSLLSSLENANGSWDELSFCNHRDALLRSSEIENDGAATL